MSETPSRLLPVGSSLQGQNGSYRVIATPQAGAYAYVYRVQAADTGREAILKLNPPDRGNEPQVLTRVGLALAGAGLAGHTVTVIDRLTTPPTGWSGHIEEIAVGNPLRKLQPTEPQALRIAIEFAEVLRACAQNGIAYLDLKPLDHIFWQPESWQVTIIDWNVAKTDASPAELRDDVLKFCERLPELFTCHRQDDPRNSLHPLSWSLRDMADRRGRKLSYATWSLLAQTSLSWGNPLLRDLRDLVRVPRLVEQQTRSDDDMRQLVDAAWDAVLNQLKALLNLWSSPTNRLAMSASIPASRDSVEQAETLVQHMSEASVHIANTTKDPTAAGWLDYGEQAVRQAESCRKGFLLVGNVLRRDSWQQHERLLRGARLLRPQDADLALAWSAYAIWDRVGGNHDATWKELILNLVSGHAQAVRAQLETQGESLAQDVRDTCRRVEANNDERGLPHIWSKAVAEFQVEALAWTWLAEAEKEQNGVKCLKLIEEVFAHVPEHPLASPIKTAAEAAQRRQELVVRARDRLFDALRNDDPLAARQSLDNLQQMTEEDSVAKRLVRRLAGRVQQLEDQRGIQARVKRDLASWDTQSLQAALLALADLPETAANKALVVQVEERLKSIKDLNTNLIAIRGQLATSASGNSLANIETRIQTLHTVAQTLQHLDHKYPEAPQVGEVWNQLRTLVIRSVEDIPDPMQRMLQSLPMDDDTTLDTRKDTLQRASNSLNTLQDLHKLPPVIQRLATEQYIDRNQWQIVDNFTRQVETRLQETGVRYQYLQEQFEEHLRSETADLVSLAEQLNHLPPSLKEHFAPGVRETRQTSIVNQLEEALHRGELRHAEELIEEVPSDLKDDDFNHRLTLFRKEAAARNLVNQAEELLQHILDAEQVSQARVILSQLNELDAAISADLDLPEVRGRLSELVEQVDRQRFLQESLGDIHNSINNLQQMLKGLKQANHDRLEALRTKLTQLEANLQQTEHEVRRQKSIRISGLILNGVTLLAVLGIAGAIALGRLAPADVPNPPVVQALPTPSTATSATDALLTSTQEPEGAGTSPSTPTPTDTPVMTPSPVPSVAPTEGPAVGETQAATPWPAELVLRVVSPESIVYRDQALTQPLWQYGFQRIDREGSDVTAELTTLEEPAGGVVQVAAYFVIYKNNLTLDGDMAQKVNASARLRSVTQRAADSGYDDIQALLATMLADREVGADVVIEGPNEEAGIGTWYKVRLTGWIPVKAVEPAN